VKRSFLGLGLCFFLLSAFPAYAAGPLATVEADVNKVLDVLRNKGLDAEAKKEKLRTLYSQMFDEVELSKRTLGANWKKLDPAQQKEFILLYRQVLEKAYIDKILSYTDQKIVFSREIMFSDRLAQVDTQILTSSRKIPIDYRVILKDDAWKVYDVVIENVSLILNYRSQFNSILARKTPQQMLEILQRKVKGK
jgi:phospholipid transport system substrate-binding protein